MIKKDKDQVIKTIIKLSPYMIVAIIAFVVVETQTSINTKDIINNKATISSNKDNVNTINAKIQATNENLSALYIKQKYDKLDTNKNLDNINQWRRGFTIKVYQGRIDDQQYNQQQRDKHIIYIHKSKEK